MSDTDLVRHLIDEIKALGSKVSTMSEQVTQLRIDLATVKTDLELRQGCPGDCNRLGNSLEQMKVEFDTSLSAIREDVEQHKEVLQQVKGGWKVIAWVCGGSIAATQLVNWLIAHSTK